MCDVTAIQKSSSNLLKKCDFDGKAKSIDQLKFEVELMEHQMSQVSCFRIS